MRKLMKVCLVSIQKFYRLSDLGGSGFEYLTTPEGLAKFVELFVDSVGIDVRLF
jgi:hypothetical protein